MASFTDRQNRTWEVRLTAPMLNEIKKAHQINLTDLANDPLRQLRNDPMMLVAVIYTICRKQIESAGLSSDDFAELLPSPPDSMLEAVGDSIVNFYPSGQHTHVREVLAKYAAMAQKTDDLAIAKMQAVLEDTSTFEALSNKADLLIQEQIQAMLQQRGTSNTTAQT